MRIIVNQFELLADRIKQVKSQVNLSALGRFESRSTQYTAIGKRPGCGVGPFFIVRRDDLFPVAARPNP
ncbi:MAG TPA: hypothetical protein QF564_12575, partial [Pirellulaceae bacterium]|nr:hypothetical protein [Pirellulaceae bacterium]